MGTWNVSITGNDTARDLHTEYTVAFWRYDVEEALKKLDKYVRDSMFDESDPEEWCNYVYSLADFMWKKGILTDSVREKAIQMIDSSFGLEIWEEAGEKTLNARKRALQTFKEKLLSQQPPKKKIKPDIHNKLIFADGDIIAVQLQTAGKPYTESHKKELTLEEFHALDGKYVLMQLINCPGKPVSSLVPEVQDYWANFRLLDGFYDSIPEDLDFDTLQDAMIQGSRITPVFTCDSSMFHFKKRNYKVLGNRKDLSAPYEEMTRKMNHTAFIFWNINKPWANPDSDIASAMGMKVTCGEFSGSEEERKRICEYALLVGWRDYRLSREECEAILNKKTEDAVQGIEQILAQGGKVYGLTYGKEIGIVTVLGQCVDHLYIEGKYQGSGFGTRLLRYAFSCAGQDAHMDVPAENEKLIRVCRKAGLAEDYVCSSYVRMKKAEVAACPE